MEQGTQLKGSSHPRICMLSMRDVKPEISMCHTYEFEDVICEVDDVRLISFQLQLKNSNARKLKLLASKIKSGLNIPPHIMNIRLTEKCDVFFMACQTIDDIRKLQVVEGWKDHCKISVCWLEEFWPGSTSQYKAELDILAEFDYVIMNCKGGIPSVKEMLSGHCNYMPTGIDTLRFSPYPDYPVRSVDVYSLGRRSSILHQDLLTLSRQQNMFYIYDTINPYKKTISSIVRDYRAHRDLIANIIKRSQFFLVNPPKFDEISNTKGQNEIGFRFFEGAASGAVMIGKSPGLEDFRKHFDWPDAVIEIPYEKGSIGDILEDLKSKPERLDAIRSNSIRQSLLRHDWAYRWHAVLDIIGLEAMPGLIDREHRLKKICDTIPTTVQTIIN